MRAVHPVIKNAICAEAMKGALAKSGRLVKNNLMRFRMKGSWVINANLMINKAAMAHPALKFKYFAAHMTRTTNICLDATRLGGLEVFWMLVTAVERDLSSWGLPQVPKSTVKMSHK